MRTHPVSMEKGYTASVVISPMMHGEDKKDQDRARFFEPGQSACLCDGVTSSPDSATAAELVTSFAPALFQGNVTERLKALCDLLMAHRLERLATNNVHVPPGTPEPMRQMLQKVAQTKKADSFQTTIIAAQFTSDEQVVVARVVKCGDSALFAFSGEGELLVSSLAFASPRQSGGRPREQVGGGPSRIDSSFGPGDEILVRIDGPLSEHKRVTQVAGIDPAHLRNWIACTPVDISHNGQEDVPNLAEMRPHVLVPGDRLVVPKYLYGTLLTSGGHQYLILRYSSSIRVVSRNDDSVIRGALGGSGSTTLVLPDHFYAGAFDCFTDTFPRQTQFLLCSDGFYSAFADWRQMYQWLCDNAEACGQEDQRAAVLEQLHTQLNARKGDDDISFIWLRPRTA